MEENIGDNNGNREIRNSGSIAATAVKLPTFWSPCPEAWFILAESQFNSKGIRQDDTKYEYVIQSLPLDIIMNVLDCIQNPPQENKYEALKTTLIQRFTESEEKKLEQLLCNSEMGDRKPSEFYRSMEILAGTSSHLGKDLIRKLWMRKLPSSINIALMSSGKQNIQDLLVLADKIFDVSKLQYISAINSSNPFSEQKSVNINDIELIKKINFLENKIENLVDLVKELTINRNNNNFHKSRSRSRSHSSHRNNKPLCWYHFKFGNKASKCVKPCNFSNSKN